MRSRLVVVVVLCAGFWTCSADVPAGSCTANEQCPSGQVCAAEQCKKLCASDLDCDDRSKICSSGLCEVGQRGGAPTINAVDGDGTPDGATDHAAHHVHSVVTISGQNLLGAAVSLSDNTTTTPLEVCGATPDSLQVVLPPNVSAGDYLLTVATQAGSCGATLQVLQGEAGPAGSADTPQQVYDKLQVFLSGGGSLNATTLNNYDSSDFALDGHDHATPPRARVFSSSGFTDIGSTLGAYTEVPDLRLDFALDGTYVVLTQVDMTVVSGTANAWVALRLAVNADVDDNWTHTQPSGSGEDDHLHLFRIDTLGPGNHNIRAEWGDSGSPAVMSNFAGNPQQVWQRKISAIAIPIETGVSFGYVNGTSDACQNGSSAFADIPQMALTANLPEESWVLTEFDINWVGASASWKAARLTIDGNADLRATHSNPFGSPDEDDHVHVFRIDSLAAGSHAIRAQWGDTGSAGPMCNNAASGPYWGRRLGYIALPKSSGARGFVREGTTDIASASTAFATIPDSAMSISLDRSGFYAAISHFDITVVPTTAGDWGAVRMVLDNQTDVSWTHTQPSDAGEDDHLHQHRVDILTPGSHVLRAEWYAGVGTVSNLAGNGAAVWTRRMGMLAIPVDATP